MVWVLGIFISQKGYPVSLSLFSGHHSRKWGEHQLRACCDEETLPSQPVPVLF